MALHPEHLLWIAGMKFGFLLFWGEALFGHFELLSSLLKE